MKTLIGEQELVEVNRKITQLLEEKDVLVRKFFIRNSENASVEDLFKAAVKYCGLAPAIHWYMKAYDVSLLRARKEIFKLIGKGHLLK